MANRRQRFDQYVHCIKDLEKEAAKKMPKMYLEYFNEGAMDLITLHDNCAAFDRYKIRPRFLIKNPTIDTSVTILGTKVSFPLGFAPAAMQRLAHPDGEVGTSKAAAKMGVANSMEDVIAQGSGNPYLYQVTMLKDRSLAIKMIQRAERAGYKAILLTVNGPKLGKRLNEYRNSFSMPEGQRYPNIDPEMNMDNLEDKGDALAYENDIDWAETAAFLREHARLPIWIKGIATAEDVALAARHGFGGVVISNMGGRQLDSEPSSLDALRECAPVAAKAKMPIAVDGGIRRGTDIFKALALGADFCFVGRVPIWGLALCLCEWGNNIEVFLILTLSENYQYNGTKGVELALQILQHEFELVMGLTGSVVHSLTLCLLMQLTKMTSVAKTYPTSTLAILLFLTTKAFCVSSEK